MSSAKRQPSAIEQLIQQAYGLSRAELLELRGAIEALAEATAPQVIDLEAERQERRAESPAPAAPDAPRGWIEVAYKTQNGKRYGPYQYLRWRSGNIKKSTYLGRVTNA